MKQVNSQIVQAFPIQENTFVGTPNGFEPKGHNILHAAGDGDITFSFGATDVVVTVANGQDLAFGQGVTSITAGFACWIS